MKNYFMFKFYILFSLIIFVLGQTKAAPRKGGTFSFNLAGIPTTLNPLSSTDGYAGRVQQYVMDTLIDRDIDSNEWVPHLAKSWTISKDGKYYDFELRENVKWHDGKPLTAEDVKFSFDAILKPEIYSTASKLSFMENFSECKVLGKNKVRFIAKKVYFGNLSSAGLMAIVPKHIYENPTKDKKSELNKTLVGSGPYVLDRFDRKKAIQLIKNPNWWGKNVERLKNQYNFEKIYMRFVKDDQIAFEMFKRKQFDFLGLSPEYFVKKAKGPGWNKKYFKKKVENNSVKGYGFIAWNNKHLIFKDKNVRKALSMLMDREKMNKKFDYSMNTLTTGPLYRQSPYTDKSIAPISFDPKQALKILRSSGWSDSDKNGVLDKKINGKKVELKFTLLEPSKDLVKYMTLYQQDLKRSGIVMDIKIIEWNAFIKKLDERDFDAVRLAWGGGLVEWDPKQIWHTSSIKNKGSNFISYSNKKVDKLIDEARQTIDEDKRKTILKSVFRLISNDFPYTFMMNRKFDLYSFLKNVKMHKDTYKYSIGTNYWWLAK